MTGTLYRMFVSHRRRLPAGVIATALAAFLFSLFAATASFAEELVPDGPAPSPWGSGSDKRKNTTSVERGKLKGSGVQLGAFLTGENRQQITQGLVWRVYRPGPRAGKSKLILESHDSSPIIKLPPGEYAVNAAFGRANLTRKISVKPDEVQQEGFVLNAGGLRVSALIGGNPAPPGAVSYSIYSDDRDNAEGSAAIISGAKPGLIVRLNSGIYRLVSLYGDANAKIEADVTVEPGKLTETTLTHTGGKATFKLVTHEGGEAMPDTRWTVQTDDGDTVKESVGALPTHVLAPGDYVVTASSGGRIYQNKFQIKDGDAISVEVLMTNTPDDSSAHLSSGATTIAPMSGGGMPMDFKSQ